jgi:uncharacterized membrane protein YqiK
LEIDVVELVLFLVFLVFLTFAGLLALVIGRRFYVRVPPGRVAVRTGGGGARVVRGDNVFVIPLVHRMDFVHAEVEQLDLEGKELSVQLGDQIEEVIQAFHAFGAKPVDEIRRLLQAIVDSAKGDESAAEAKLAQVGHRSI